MIIMFIVEEHNYQHTPNNKAVTNRFVALIGDGRERFSDKDLARKDPQNEL